MPRSCTASPPLPTSPAPSTRSAPVTEGDAKAVFPGLPAVSSGGAGSPAPSFAGAEAVLASTPPAGAPAEGSEAVPAGVCPFAAAPPEGVCSPSFVVSASFFTASAPFSTPAVPYPAVPALRFVASALLSAASVCTACPLHPWTQSIAVRIIAAAKKAVFIPLRIPLSSFSGSPEIAFAFIVAYLFVFSNSSLATRPHTG